MSPEVLKADAGKKWAYWVKVIIVFFMGWTLIWTYRTILTPIYPQIKQSLGIASNTEISYIAIVFYIFYTAFQIPCGLMADRFGRKKTLLSAFFIFAMGMATISFANSLAMVLVGAAFVGLGQSAYFGCAYSITSSVVAPNLRGFASAMVNCGCAVGMAVGLIGSTYLVDALGIDWHMLLRGMAVLAIVMMVVFLTQLKNDSPVLVKPSAPKEPSPQTKEKSFLKALLSPKLAAAFFLYFATCYGYYTIVNWLPAFLQNERDVHGVMVGYIASITAFASIPGALFISRLSDKMRARRIPILVALEALSILTLFVAVCTTQMAVLVIALLFYGLIGKMTIDPIIVSYVVEHTSQSAYSRALAVLNFSGMIGSILTTYITAAVADSLGSMIVGFYIACLLLLVATVVLVVIDKKEKRKEAMINTRMAAETLIENN